MPANIESFSLSYTYTRHQESEIRVENGCFTSRQEINIIDLGLIGPDGRQVGASGSDKTSIVVSETHATPGYHPCKLVPGEWQIMVGAYHVAEAGVNVLYELSFTSKYRRLYKGDLHTHTIASDGVLRIEELAQHARSNGLDYLAITDHNVVASTDTLLEHAHLTSHAFHDAADRAHVSGVRLHDLRHSAVTRFFELGLNVMEVAAISGHKTLAMLHRYCHLSPERLVARLDQP